MQGRLETHKSGGIFACKEVKIELWSLDGSNQYDD